MNYSNPSINLSDGITGYITTNEDESDNTQYLSVLSQEISLQEMNVTLTTDKVVENNEETNQPFIFTVDGTNEIYGVQVAQDEDGNLRKYQIQYSENINGDLVPMLETIQFLPLDEEQVLSSEEICAEVTQLNDNFVVKNEEFITNSKNDFNLHEVTEPHINRDQEEWNIPTTNLTSFHMKHEPTTLFDQCSILQNEEGKTVTIEAENTIQYASVDSESTEIAGDMEIDHPESRIMSVQHLDIQHCLKYEGHEETTEHEHFEPLYSEENHITDSNHLVVDNSMVENSQQEDLYHILDNSISNSKIIYDQSMQTILKESIDHPKTNILKKSVQKSLLKDFANSDHKIVYVQTLPEKENLTVVDIESFTKPSSRSLLKCNQPPRVLKQTDTLYSDDSYSRQNSYSKATPRTKETKQIQAYLRTKEAKQARQFMNFINSTTIPQVPERKERLPRKQQIKPVNHPDENIVVKEMIVSSNGFVEPISAEEKKYLPVTEYVELLDSGDETNSMCNNKKKRKNNKKDSLIEIEIEISDTDESDAAELEPGKFRSPPKAKNGLKKKRGRPPKHQTSVDEKNNVYPNSPPKMSRLESDVESVTSTLEVITMESEMNNESENQKNTDSLKKNLENSCVVESSTKNREPQVRDLIITERCMSKEKSAQTNLISKVSQLSGESTCRKAFECKYECEKCKSKFINKFVLNRHDCILKFGSTFSCDICQQKFANSVCLNTHKKSHIKEPILKSSLTKISQGKIFPKKEVASSSSSTKPLLSSSRTSILSSKNPKQVSLLVKNIKQTFPLSKSKHLVVPATTPVQLPRHSTLPEKKCNSVDASENVELENSRKPIEEGIYKPPLNEVTPGKTPRSNIFKWEKKCDKCSMNFDNNTSWFDHQVLNHGFKTPDKTIGEKRQKKIVKDVTEHKGIRAGSTVAKSFSMLKNRVQKI